MEVISEDIGASIKIRQIQDFYERTGGLIDTVVVILGTIEPDKFTTFRWIKSMLLKCGIDRKDVKIMSCITALTGKLACIEGREYDEGSFLVDLEVEKMPGKGKGGSRRPGRMSRLNTKGRKHLKEIIKNNPDCFKD